MLSQSNHELTTFTPPEKVETYTLQEWFKPVLDELLLVRGIQGLELYLEQEVTCDTNLEQALATILNAAKLGPSYPNLHIDTLYIGVHPDFDYLLSEQHFEMLEKWLLYAQSHENIGLIMIPWLRRPSTPETIIEQVQNSRVHDRFVKFWMRFYDWECRTRDTLVVRFCYWPGLYPLEGFVKGDNELAVDFLTLRFGAEPRAYVHGQDDLYLFKRIVVFGQHPSSCVARQLYDCNLRRLAFMPEGLGLVPRAVEDPYGWYVGDQK